MSFSAHIRKQNIEKLKSETFDLVIVGGGITGAGVARDAISRGLTVALVEAQDFSEGTSSRSSKLIHGGIRYLENFEFRLVFEALAERALLFKLAPHLVHPLRFLVPIYKNSRVGFWKMLAGMWLYDILALFDTPQMHESLSPMQVSQRVKSLGGNNLVGAFEYSDAFTDDDRLVMETLRDAHRGGAVITNYTAVESSEKQQGEIQSLLVKDVLSGDSFRLQGKQFVSAVGPWTDIFGNNHVNDWREQLRPTKGVHLVFSKERIAIEKAVVMAVEKRIIFVIPRNEMVIVGTTDTDFSDDPAAVLTQVDDVHYIIQALNQYFPDLKISVQDIISSYSGVRPLVNDGSSTEGKTSREHRIWDSLSNLTFVAGGKYTTYRKMSEEVVDFVLRKMPFDEQMSYAPSNTQKALNPLLTPILYERAQELAGAWSTEYSFDQDLTDKLVMRFGSEAQEILKNIKNNYGHCSQEEAFWLGQAQFAIEHTMCSDLCDFYWRRSPLFLAHKDHGLEYLSGIADVFSKQLNWTEDMKSQQIEKLQSQIKRELSWQDLVAL